MKILVVGGGGREHAIAWRLAQDAEEHEIYCAPGNAGTVEIATNVAIGAEDIEGLAAWAEAEKPDLVITHWPIDSHRDHRACSLLVYDAWRQLDHSFELYYFEAMTGLQSMNFTPDEYVDISSTVDLKHEAIMCHRTQEPEWMLDEWHIAMEKMRGNEFQCKAAEAFVHQRWRSSEIVK